PRRGLAQYRAGLRRRRHRHRRGPGAGAGAAAGLRERAHVAAHHRAHRLLSLGAAARLAVRGICSLADESIPEKLRRTGLLSVYTGQLTIPGINYPLRLHYEVRDFADVFLLQSAKDVAFPFPALSERYDLVIRGGPEGRDFQLYFTAEPENLAARTWSFK